MKGNKLSYEDPFDNIPDENVKEVPVADEPKFEVSSGVDAEGYTSVTIKGTGRQSDRWVVVRYATPAALLAALKAPELKEVLDYSWKIAEYDAKRAPQPTSAPPASNAVPPAAAQAPNGEKRFCSHGEMVFKSGVSRAGNAYKLFSCTAPREQQCPAEYLKK